MPAPNENNDRAQHDPSPAFNWADFALRLSHGRPVFRMLTTLLTSDSIPHRMFPVEGYAELEARTQDLEGDSEVSLSPCLDHPLITLQWLTRLISSFLYLVSSLATYPRPPLPRLAPPHLFTLPRPPQPVRPCTRRGLASTLEPREPLWRRCRGTREGLGMGRRRCWAESA